MSAAGLNQVLENKFGLSLSFHIMMYDDIIITSSTILAFQLVPNSRYMFLILGSGVPNNRDPSLKLGSGDPETRYGFQRKNGLFLVLKTQKILKHNPKLYPLGIFSLAAFVLDLFMFCGFW